MSELKPCPFCGVERSDVGFIAHTDECYLMIKYMGSYTKKELGDAWNTRPIEDKLRAELARRDKIIRSLKEVGGRMYIAHDEKDIRECEDWRALMKELE